MAILAVAILAVVILVVVILVVTLLTMARPLLKAGELSLSGLYLL